MKVAILAPAVGGLGLDGVEEVRGGGERYPAALAIALAEQGIDVDLVTFGPRSVVATHHSGLTVRVLPSKYWKGNRWDPLAWKLLSLPRRYDIVHVHTMNKADVVIALASRVFGSRVVLTTLGGGAPAGIRRGLWRLFDGALFISNYSKQVEPELARLPSDVIYGGADPELDHMTSNRSSTAPKDAFLFVGRLTPHKGIDVLVQALPNGAVLNVVGPVLDREYLSHLHNLAHGKAVAFLHDIADTDLPDLYRRSVALVLPSVIRDMYGSEHQSPELLGLVALEAMWHGAPAIVSNVGGIPEIVRHGVTGYIVEPGDVVALRRVLAKLWSDRALAESLGASARKEARERYSWGRVAEDAAAFYTAVLSSPRAPVLRHRV